MKMGVNILDDDDNDIDLEFLSHIEAAEAHALSLSSSSKRRRLTHPPSPPPHLSNFKSENHPGEPVVVEEGGYTAALKGSKSLTWQKQTHVHNQAPPPMTSRAGGSDACFKCGKDGHWARDCNQSSSMEGDCEKACPCGSGNCLVLTANTERNRGRKFFKCPIRQENGGCGFFQWCDESPANHGPMEAERTWKNGGLQQVYQHPSSQGNSRYTKPWNEYDDGNNSTSHGFGDAQKFETTNKRSSDMKSGTSCFKCGNEGHWARDCSTPSVGTPTTTSIRDKTSSDTCFKCGGSGHWARDCTQGKSTKLPNW